jgi:hypothetical protein
VAWKRDHKVFYETKVYVVSLVLSLVFKIVFGIFLAHLVCLKSVQLKMSGSFQVSSRNTLIPCPEKSFWSLKTTFWKKNCTKNSKTVIKKFFYVPLKQYFDLWRTCDDLVNARTHVHNTFSSRSFLWAHAGNCSFSTVHKY